MTTYLNGGRGWLSDAAAASVHRMDSAFGRILPITSAGRTYQEQADAYYRYKYQGGPLALPPGTSPHESGNAVDWGSSVWGILGLDWGLGYRGAPINNHGFARDVSSETWHTPYTQSRDNYNGSPAGGASGGPSILAVQQYLNAKYQAGLAEDGIDGPNTQAAVRAYQGILGVEQDGVWGPGTEAAHVAYTSDPYAAWGGTTWVKAIQNKLNRLNYGPLDEDGLAGPMTKAAITKFQNDNGLSADGVAGPITNNKLDEKLTATPLGANQTSRPTVDIQKLVGATILDGQYGPETTAKVIEWQKKNGLTPDGIWGPASDAKGFPAVPVTEWPVNGYNATTRAVADIQKLVGAEADGSYGPATSKAVAAWQNGKVYTTESGTKIPLTPDGIWGPQSDAVGFPGVALPDPVVPPGSDASYGKKTPLYPGATWADISPNKSPRTDTIQYFVIHHAASTASKQSQIDRFMTANDRNVSPNWFIAADGTVAEIVPPDDYRAWTTGQFDHKAVTVETQNTSGDPTWGISAASHEAIAKVVAWASKRYGFPIDRQHVIGHREVPGQSTACPGPSMNLVAIVERAKIIAATMPDPEVPVDPEEPEEPVDPEEPTDPTPVDEWVIRMSKAEAVEAGKLLDQLRKLFP